MLCDSNYVMLCEMQNCEDGWPSEVLEEELIGSWGAKDLEEGSDTILMRL